MKLKKISKFALVGGFGFILAGGMSGCSSENNSEISQNKGAFVIIEETQPGKYKIKEEFPASENRVVLKKLDGTEKVLTKEEMDELIAQENAKIDAGTSGLTNPSLSSGGMGLGEALLEREAGAIIGSYIGNKLFSNPNFQAQKQNAFSNKSAYEKSVNSFKNAQNSSAKSGKSGFFGKNSGSSDSVGA